MAAGNKKVLFAEPPGKAFGHGVINGYNINDTRPKTKLTV